MHARQYEVAIKYLKQSFFKFELLYPRLINLTLDKSNGIAKINTNLRAKEKLNNVEHLLHISC